MAENTPKEVAIYPTHPLYPNVVIDTIQKAIWAVMAEIGYVQKKKSPNLNYTFAGEASLIRAIRPFMEKYGIIMSVVDTKDVFFEDYQTKSGSSMRRTTLLASVRFYHAPSGTYIDVTAPGEGADSGDKSGNKANTCAYKYALRQTFVIETGDDPDETASEKSEKASTKTTAKTETKAPAGNGTKPKSYKDLLALADKEFKFTDAQVQTTLAKHKKFVAEDWDTYVSELKAAFEKAA